MFRDQDIHYVEQTRDGGFVVAGTVGTDNRAEAWIFKLDPIGNIVWEKAYEVAIRTEAFSIHETRDGGYIVAGHSSLGALVLRLDREGNIRCQKTLNGSGFTTSSVVETSDHGFVVAGASSGPFLLKLDAKGAVVWQKVYGGANSFFNTVQKTRDMGLIVAASTDFYSNPCCEFQAWVLKLDENGRIGSCPLGAAYNATLTDAIPTVGNPTVGTVSTNATSIETGVTVSTNTLGVQTQCMGSLDRDHESEPVKHNRDSPTMEN